MTPARFEIPLIGDVQPGDRWFVESVAAGTVTFARVQAAPGTFRAPGDGLHPRVPQPDTRPLFAEEVERLNAEMDAAMARGKDAFEAWPFSPDNPLNQAPTVDDRVRG